MTKDQEKFFREVLLQEYLRVCTEIRALESYNDKIVGFGMTLMTIAFAYGIAEKVYVVFLILPFSLLGVFAYFVMNLRWIHRMGGYKYELEVKLNQTAGKRAAVWEHMVLNADRYNASFTLLWIVYTIVSLGIFSISVNYVSTEFGRPAALCLAVAFGALATLLAVAVKQVLDLGDDSRRLAAAELEKSA